MFKFYYCFKKMSLLVIGNDNKTTKLYDILFSFIVFRIKKYNMHRRIENLEEVSQLLRMSIKENVVNILNLVCTIFGGKKIFLTNV